MRTDRRTRRLSPTWTLACLAAGMILVASSSPAAAQSWVRSREGPGPGDSGPRTDAIVLRQMIEVYDSPARLEDGTRVGYNHPSMLCETRKGTLIFMWNGGRSEGEGGNRIFYSRKPKGAGQWSDPKRLEDQQIDFGTLYQPTADGAPVLAGYWLGAPRRSGTRMIVSTDDGMTWSDPMEFPATDDPFWQASPARGHYRWSMSPPIEFPDGTLWFASEQRHRYAAIVVVPPDNYTGREKGGSQWTSIHPDLFVQGRGVHGDFLVLSGDYDRVLFANRGGGTYVTEDRGRTWRKVPNVPGAGGGAGLAALSLDVDGGACQGWHVMAGSRHPQRSAGLFVYVSRNPTDPGSWRKVLNLHGDIPGEDADPSMIQSRFDGKIHLLFTGRGEPKLKYYVLDPEVLVRQAPPARIERTWPKAPSDLKGAITGPGRVELTWTDNSDSEQGFRIWYKRFEEGFAPKEVEVPANTTSHTLTGVGPGRYGFRVRAYNAEGGSKFSRLVTLSLRRGGGRPQREPGGED